MSRWNKIGTKIGAVSAFDTRGGVQKKDSQYNSQTQIPPPDEPPPLSPSSQPHGENASYYSYSPLPYHSLSPTSTWPRTETQGYQPPVSHSGYNAPHSQHPYASGPPSSNHGGSYPPPHHWNSNSQNQPANITGQNIQHSPPLQHAQPHYPQGNVGPSSANQQYSNIQVPPASDNGSHLQSSPPAHTRNFSQDSFDNSYTTGQWDNSNIDPPIERRYEEPNQNYTFSSYSSPHTPQRSFSEYSYQDSRPPHDCTQNWNNILGRCSVCEPYN